LLINNIEDQQMKQKLLDIHSNYKDAKLLINLEVENEDRDLSFITPEMSIKEIHEIMINLPELEYITYHKVTIIKVSPNPYFSNMHYVVFPNSYCGSLRSDKFRFVDKEGGNK